MDDIKITAIVVPEPIFPSTSGKAEIDGLTALSVKWAMEHNERVAAVPEADKRKHINHRIDESAHHGSPILF